MVDIEAALRGAALAMFLLWSVLLWRDGNERVGAAFATGVASYVICSAPGFALPPQIGWQWGLLALCLGNPLMFWLFARCLFEDGFRPNWRHFCFWILYICAGLVIVLATQGPFAMRRSGSLAILTLGTIGFAVATAWVLWRGYKDDLVASRRRVRPIITAGGVLYVLVVGAAELAMQGNVPPQQLSFMNASALAGFAFITLFIFAKGASPDWFSPLVMAPSTPNPNPEDRHDITQNDPQIAHLLRLFDDHRLHREPELSVSDVARRMGLPDHQLRALINQRLGYRNFATFINGFRLAETKSALLDPTQSGVPISTIALDAGFGSLGAFNRAFKADVGQTPSAFRQALPIKD